jgi:hypothetical protein
MQDPVHVLLGDGKHGSANEIKCRKVETMLNRIYWERSVELSELRKAITLILIAPSGKMTFIV